MGLRLLPRTLDAIQAGFRLAKYHAIDKPRQEKEAAEREAQRQRQLILKREEDQRRHVVETQQAEERAHAAKTGEMRAIIEMTEEARRKQFEHESRMLDVRERHEDIAQQGVERRKRERDEWVEAIASVTDRFGGSP